MFWLTFFLKLGKKEQFIDYLALLGQKVLPKHKCWQKYKKYDFPK